MNITFAVVFIAMCVGMAFGLPCKKDYKDCNNNETARYQYHHDEHKK